jgi:hypothetical protein
LRPSVRWATSNCRAVELVSLQTTKLTLDELLFYYNRVTFDLSLSRLVIILIGMKVYAWGT